MMGLWKHSLGGSTTHGVEELEYAGDPQPLAIKNRRSDHFEKVIQLFVQDLFLVGTRMVQGCRGNTGFESYPKPNAALRVDCELSFLQDAAAIEATRICSSLGSHP